MSVYSDDMRGKRPKLLSFAASQGRTGSEEILTIFA
jgi:hypothetical protein